MGFKASWGTFAALCILFYAGFGHSLFLLNGDEPLESAIRRVRREANESEGSSDESSNTKCVIKHLKNIESKLEKELPPEKNVSKAAALAKPHQIFSNADPNTLIKFCTIYKTSRARLAGCGDSEMKSFAAKALAVVDFVCIDRYDDFISAFPCIQKVDKLTDPICQKNCSEYEAAAEKLNSAGAAVVKKYSPREIKELFADSCSYVSCYMECQKPTLEKQCGMKVLELEMSSIGVTFRNLDEMMSNSSASNLWPRECKPLSAMGAHEKQMLKEASNQPAPVVLPISPAVNATSVNSTSISAPPAPQPAPIPATIPPQAPAAPKNSTVPEIPQSKPAVVVVPAAAPANSTNAPVPAKALPVAPGNSTAGARLRSAHRN